jgi:hypothetical protein
VPPLQRRRRSRLGIVAKLAGLIMALAIIALIGKGGFPTTDILRQWTINRTNGLATSPVP